MTNSGTKHLNIIGAIHVDDIATPSSALVPYASNPVSWEQRLGGVAANAACAAARYAATIVDNTAWTLSVSLTAAVGDDATASSLHKTLETLGVQAKFHAIAGTATGKYSAVMTQEGELFIGLADVSVAESLSGSDAIGLLETGIDLERSVLLIDANLSAQCLARLVDWTTHHSIPCAAMSVSPVKSQRLLPLAPKIDVLFCNRREALALNPALKETASLEQLADALISCNFQRFVLTDGNHPLIIHDSAGRFSLAVPATNITRNVNGAGDALAGASTAAWANGHTLFDAVQQFGLPQARAVVEGDIQSPHVHGALT